MIKTMHEVLKDARVTLAERGLAKNTLQDGEGRVCLRGAILLAGYGYTPRGGVMSATSEQFMLLLDCETAMGFKQFPGQRNGLTNAACWNNWEETTEEMVLEAFDRGIEATKPQEVQKEVQEAERIPALA